MTNNIMEKYIKITTTFIKDFTKMFFAEKYNEEIAKEYISTYIDARIYNFGEDSQKFFYRRIYFSLLNKKKELEEKFEKIDKQFLEENVKIYQFIFYMDGVRPITDLDEFVSLICEKRKKSFDLDSIGGLNARITKLVKKYKKDKEDFFKEFETEDFSLAIDKYILIDDTYKVDIDYNFKIPYIYSNEVINEVYNAGTVNEDKLIIEYILLSLECIKDIEKGNFDKKYIVNLANTLLTKQSKLKQTLRVINNAAIQDKVFLKIYYKDFEENKEILYSLIKDGYKFAVILDDSFNPTQINLKKVSIFDYLIVPQNGKNYQKIMQLETKIINTIIYDL